MFIFIFFFKFSFLKKIANKYKFYSIIIIIIRMNIINEHSKENNKKISKKIIKKICKKIIEFKINN